MNSDQYSTVLLGSLKQVLLKIQETDGKDYTERNMLVYLAISIASQLGYPCGFRIDEKEPAWPVAYIELPTGQVSWHMPQYPASWDGHSTEEKYQRIAAFV